VVLTLAKRAQCELRDDQFRKATLQARDRALAYIDGWNAERLQVGVTQCQFSVESPLSDLQFFQSN
jgi:hypothetical protein